MIKNVSKYAYIFVMQECIISFDFGVKFDPDMCLTVFCVIHINVTTVVIHIIVKNHFLNKHFCPIFQ